MKKQNAMRWVKALRSGKYKQGTYGLRKMDIETGEFAYCCLGVLCEINGLPINKNQCLPPEKWRSAIDLKTDNGRLPKNYSASGKKFGDLAGLNDYGLTFKQIANIIEKNWEAL